MAAAGEGNQHAFEGVEVLAEIPGVSNIDWVSLAPFDRGGDGFPANGGFNNIIDISRGQSEARRLVTLDVEVQEISARGALGENGAGIGSPCQRLFHFHGGLLNSSQVRAKNFQAQFGAEAGGEHVGPRLDRHPEYVGHAGRFCLLVHFGDDLFPRHAWPPLVGRFERDDRFKHGKRRGIGWSFGLARFAKDRSDFRDRAQDAVLDLQDARGFIDGHAGHGRGHEQNCAFIEHRHEFACRGGATE